MCQARMRARCTLAALSKAVEDVQIRAAQAPREERGVRAHQEQNNASVPKRSSTAASVNVRQLEVLICTSYARCERSASVVCIHGLALRVRKVNGQAMDEAQTARGLAETGPAERLLFCIATIVPPEGRQWLV